MKRFISCILALMLLASLAACGKDGLKPGGGADQDLITPDEDGVAIGYADETLRTAFFDMKIEDPELCAEFDGLTPEAGYKFLTANITLYNYTDNSQPMFDTDFSVLWEVGEGEDATFDGDYPVYEEIMDENGELTFTTKSDKQMPEEFSLGIHETRTELLLYQVPEGIQDFYIVFEENFDDGTEEGRYGDIFYVRFSA